MTNNQAALAALIERKAEINRMLKQLTALSDGLILNTPPDDVNWGHVGTLARIADTLAEITD